MPKVNIREIDRTTGGDVGYIENIVLVPGPKMEVYDENLNLITLDGLYESKTDFDNKIKKIYEIVDKKPESGEEDPQIIKDQKKYLNKIKEDFVKDKNLAVVYMLFNQGYPIEFGGLYTYNLKDESGETSGIDWDNDPYVIETSAADFYNRYSDRGKYDIRFVTPAALEDVEVMIQCIECAASRGDAIAAVFAPQVYEKKAESGESGESELVILDTSEKIDAWIQEVFGNVASGTPVRKGVSWTSTSDSTKGSYAFHLSPNFTTSITVVSPLVYTEGDAPKKEWEHAVFPGYLDYFTCFARSTASNPDWFAVAGSVRGASPLAEMDPVIKYGDVDVDLFQPREGESHIGTNVICNIRPFGNVIWGNRTMHPDLSKGLTASSFLNIRNLCCDIKKTLYRAARKFTFDANSDVLWFNFKSQITPLLEEMQANQGIRGYQIVKVHTNKKALLAARIIISPIEAVEDFDLTVELTDTIEVSE